MEGGVYAYAWRGERTEGGVYAYACGGGSGRRGEYAALPTPIPLPLYRHTHSPTYPYIPTPLPPHSLPYLPLYPYHPSTATHDSPAISQISEDEIVAFYQKATGGDDPDVLEMALIEADLRAYPITLKRRPGPTASTEASTEASTGALDASRAAGAPLCAPAAALGAGSSAASQMGGRRGWSVAARTATALGFVSKVSKTIRDLLPLDELP